MSGPLPFDLPDDLPQGAVYEVAPTTPGPGVRFVCEQPVTTMGGISEHDGWRGTCYPPCTAPAKWRATATRATKIHWGRPGWPAVDFDDGEHRNVCGTHRLTLEHEGWDIEDLPG